MVLILHLGYEPLVRQPSLGFSEPRTQSRPLFPFLGFRFPYKVLQTKKGTLFIPRFLLGSQNP